MGFEVRTEFGNLDPEAKRALVAMQHAIRAHLDDVDRRARRPKRAVTEVVEEGGVFAKPGQVVRVRPGDEDVQVVLPTPDAGNGGEDIIVSFEGDGTATGKVLVTPANSTCANPGTTTLNTPGTYRFTSTGAPGENPEDNGSTWSGPAPLSLEDLPEVSSDSLLGNISGATGTPVEVPLASLDSASVVYDAASHTFQRAGLSGAIAASQNANATTFAGVRDNGSLETARSFLNVLSSTSVLAAVAQDAGNDELELSWQRAALSGFIDAAQDSNATTSAEPLVTYSASANMSNERVLTSSTSVTVDTSVAGQIQAQRAALTGAIAASANANATTFAGIRDNGSAENDRTSLNFVSSTSNTLVVTDDAGDDELEITVQRAALTGDVTASANSNATTIANDAVTNAKLANMATAKLKGRTTSGTGDPEDLTPANSTSNTWNVATGGSISVERAALTGDVTASANSNATTIANDAVTNAKAANMAANTIKANPTASTADPQDLAISADSLPARVGGNLVSHPFATLAGASLDYSAGVIDYAGTTSNLALTSISGAQGNIDISTLECGGKIEITSTGDFDIDGFSATPAKPAGFWFRVVQRDTSGTNTGTLNENAGNTTTSIRTPQGVGIRFRRGEAGTVFYSNSRWRVVWGVPANGRLIARTTYTSGSGTHTYDARCQRAKVRMKGGGGGGAGAGAADGNVGGGGGEGGYEELDITSVPTSSAYAVGAAGSAGSSSSGTGGSGGDTTFNDGSVTRTAGGGTGGIAGGVIGEGGNGGSVDSIGGTVCQSCKGAPGQFGWLNSATGEGHGGNGGGMGAGKGGFGTSGGTGSEAGAAAGTNSGAGGGGGSRPASPNVAGAAGGAGWIVVEEYS